MAEERNTRREILRKILTLGPLAALAGAFGGNGAKPVEAYQYTTLTVQDKIGLGTETPVSKLSFGWASPNANHRIALYERTDLNGAAFRGIGMANPSNGVYGVGVWALPGGSDFPSDGNMAVFVRDAGNVGIGAPVPSNPLHVATDARGIRQNHLYTSGNAGWSSISYNAHHDAANGAWVFPDPSRTAITMEMDESVGYPRWHLYTTTTGAKTSWAFRMGVNGDTGNVGIGNSNPAYPLDVVGSIRATGSIYLSSGVLEGKAREAYYSS